MCIFADACDRLAAQQVLLDLPADAYGQVYINTGTDLPDDDALRLVAPARVQVNSLQTRPGRCALTDALTGWTGEWLPEGTAASTESPKVWVLPGASARLGVTQPDGVTRLITALPSDQLIHG
ncbi:hypothetical protein GCM10009583_06190 [Ornithinicoccus hortensis]|uniref:Uncharacterized protein n=1 Tax=Ornithinicoccus hortensis TaxID=82346 RepID=A0A542YW17_9MICO|nr:hypothetical protein FB467_3456 [Ornithinicoccus hortensis]